MLTVPIEVAEALRLPVRKTRISGTIDELEFFSEDVLKDTFSITLQASDTTDFRIGGVFVGQLKMTVINKTIIARLKNNFYDKEIKPFFDIWVDDDWYSIPLGTFYIAEATHEIDGVVLTAYDGMSKLDTSLDGISMTGSWFQLVSMIAVKCGVELGFTATDAQNFINQPLVYDLYIENDCETCRDALYWLTQIVAGFAYFTRDNKLMIREYGSLGSEAPIDTSLYPELRNSAKFSDFYVNYQELTLTHIDDGADYYHNTYSLEPGRTYELGRNPFLQFEYGFQNFACQSIIDRLRVYQFYPMQATIQCDPRIELGDHIKNFNIKAGGDVVSVVQYINFRFSKGMSIKGFGANEKIGGGSSSTAGGGGGGGSGGPSGASTMMSLSYKNAEALEIGQEWVEVSRFKFAAVSDTHVMINLMLPIISDLDGDVSVKFMINYVDDDTFVDQIDRGNNLVTIDQDYFFSKGAICTLVVLARADYYETDDRRQTAKIIALEDYINHGGELPTPVIDTTPPTFNIAEQKIRSFLWGKGINTEIGWDGFIFASDEIIVVEWPFNLPEISDTILQEFVSVMEEDANDSLNAVKLNGEWADYYEESFTLEFGHYDSVPYCGEGLATGMRDVLL